MNNEKHLAIDIGNTNIVLGIHQNSWKEVIRIPTHEFSKKALASKLKNTLSDINKVDKVTVSSVVPEATPSIEEAVNQLTGKNFILITPEIVSSLEIEIPRPDEVGTDLVANAVAARKLSPDGAIIVDFGTALTFTILKGKGILGVNILPGIKTSLDALVGNAAQLENIPLQLPTSVIGKDTKTAIQSGILWGYVGLVENMLARIENELGAPLKKFATGGLSLILPPLESQFEFIDQNLTLEGIRLIGNGVRK